MTTTLSAIIGADQSIGAAPRKRPAPGTEGVTSMQRQRTSTGTTCPSCGGPKEYRSNLCRSCKNEPHKRFDALVDRTGDCWLWLGFKDEKGYGGFSLHGKRRPAYAAAYELFVGPVPRGLQLDHLCRNPSCVNPAHLEPVTHAENQRRGLNGVLKQTCANGHPWTPENKMSNGPSKCCRICRREQGRKRYAEQTAAQGAAINEHVRWALGYCRDHGGRPATVYNVRNVILNVKGVDYPLAQVRRALSRMSGVKRGKARRVRFDDGSSTQPTTYELVE